MVYPGGWEIGSVAAEKSQEDVAHDADVRQFADRYRRTFAKTLQVCNLVPEEKWDWRPAESMSSFRELVGQIIGNELIMSRGILKGEWDLKPRLDLSRRDVAMSFFRRLHEDVVSGLAMMTNDAFHKKVPSPFQTEQNEPKPDAGPETGVTRAQLSLRMLEQELHYRGSLYVYLRLAGVEIPGLPGDE